MNKKGGIYTILIWSLCCLLVFSCKESKKETNKSDQLGDPALIEINNLIEQDTTDHELLYQRANLYYENGYYDGAISDLNKAIELDSMRAEYYHLLSDSYMDYFRSREALITMERCVELMPERIPSMLKLSETQLILKLFDASLQTCSNILNLNPQEAEAYFMMGMNLKSTGDLARAKNAFRKATEFNPDLTDAWILLGQMFEDENNPKALEYYDAAINVDRDNPATWHSKAFYLQNNDRIDEALDIYKQINLIDKDYLDAYLNAGILYMSIDSIEKAYEQFNLMTKVKPQLYISYYYRGLANEQLGRLDLAREDYNTCLRLNTNYDRAKKALDNLEQAENQ